MFRIGSKICVPAFVFLFVFAGLALIPAAADTYYWDAADADWWDGPSWDPEGPPPPGDKAYIDNDGIVQITGNVEVSQIYAGKDHSGRMQMLTATLLAAYVFVGFGQVVPEGMTPMGAMGDVGTATFDQAGGSVSVTNSLYLGYTATGQGWYNLSGGTLQVANESVGVSGTGEFNQTGGTHTVDDLRIGQQAGSWGEYTFTGGSLEIGDLEINNGWMDIDLDQIEFFRVLGYNMELLDGYIADGKIFDSTYTGEIWTVYDSQNDWTTLAYTAGAPVPEPGTIAMLVAGALGMAGVIRRRLR